MVAQAAGGPGGVGPATALGVDARGWAELAVTAVLVGACVASLAMLWFADVIRPGSFERAGRRDVSAWPWWFYVVCGVTVYLSANAAAGVGAIAGSVAARAVHANVGGRELVVQAVASVVATGVGIAAGVVLLAMIARRTERARAAGLTWDGAGGWRRAVGRGVMGIVLAYPVVFVASIAAEVVFTVLTHHKVDAINHETLRDLHEHPRNAAAWVMAGTAVVGAPVLEELMFRVFFQSGMLRLTGRTWPAILITSGVFALVHLGGGVRVSEWYVMAPLFTLGVAMGVAYERTRTPVTSMVMHAVFNLVNVVLTVG